MTATTIAEISDYAEGVARHCDPRFLGEDPRAREIAEGYRNEIGAQVRDALLSMFGKRSIEVLGPVEGPLCWLIEADVLEQMRDELSAVMGTLSLLGVFASAEVKAHLENLSGQIERVRVLTVPPDALGAPAHQGRRFPTPIDEIADAVRNAVMSCAIPLPDLAVPIAQDAAWVTDLRQSIARVATAAVKRVGGAR